MQLNEPSCIEVFGDLDLEALQKAFNQFLERHEVLRCGFKRENGVIVSFLDPTATTVPMTVLKVGLPIILQILNASMLSLQSNK